MLDGFWLDIKIFLVVEVVVLVLGLVVAVARSSRAPGAVSAAPAGRHLHGRLPRHPDDPGGLPDRLRGPGARAVRGAERPRGARRIALALSYSAYVAEVYRAGIDSIHPGQRAAALALGLTPAQSTRFVVLPQAVRRVVPPLLNDFIALQKDVALVSILGPLEAFRVAQIEASSTFNYTPLRGRRLPLPARDGPDGAPGRPAAGARARAAAGRRCVTPPVARGAGRDQGVRRHRGAARRRPRGTRAPGDRADRRVGSGKSTLLRCIDLLDEIDDGDVLLDGEVDHRPLRRPGALRRRWGSCSRRSTCSRT